MGLNMEITQFIMQYNAKIKGKSLNEEEDLKIISNMIHPKKYLSFSKKKNIVQDIIKNTIIQDDNLNIMYDGCEKYLYTIITLINEYTDLNIDEKGYDQICANRLLHKIIASFGEEYDVVIGMIDIYMEELELKHIDIRKW